MADLSKIHVILASFFLLHQFSALGKALNMASDIRVSSFHLMALIDERWLNVRQDTSDVKR